MNILNWFLKKQSNKNAYAPKSLPDSPLIQACKVFLATGKASEELAIKLAFQKKQNSSLSDFEAVELILDHAERLQQKK